MGSDVITDKPTCDCSTHARTRTYIFESVGRVNGYNRWRSAWTHEHCRLWCVYFCCMSLNAWPKSVIHHRKYTKQHGACDAGQLSSDYRLCHYSRYRATSARLADGVGIDKHVLEWSVGPRIDMLWTACLHRSCSSPLPFGRFVFFETFFLYIIAIFVKYFFN